MSRRKHTIAILALCFLAAPLVAARALQDVGPDTARVMPPVAAPVTIAIGVAAGEPTLVSAAITPAGVTRRTTTDAKNTMPALSAFMGEGGKSPAMIIVGSAALLVGAVVGGKGGTIIMIGGGVLGLVGLWNYLQ